MAIGTASGLDVDHVVGAARLLVTRFPEARIRVNGTPVDPLSGAVRCH